MELLASGNRFLRQSSFPVSMFGQTLASSCLRTASDSFSVA
jgi:hypothetical protein